ncbi:uncharacterized protein BO97DRAFT_44386 [Aspergillus homomorphus CBS 101889]|uniref:Uncharacterized protein n=1 Tax=Aspergillus homomorphus (strain CBS 101889) TaxID=1450537 RepID=A0A395HYX7_ASPHC|nr:hypothetical protein BO97DRAFT_44386 [Aspergillus homomorphus CBS 101889]RAL13142.1 hypothetical protein BO97DRAFT_44386 [Aspergillus homomorphus CBS 101889]
MSHQRQNLPSLSLPNSLMPSWRSHPHPHPPFTTPLPLPLPLPLLYFYLYLFLPHGTSSIALTPLGYPRQLVS